MQLVEQGARTETLAHYVTDTRASQFRAKAYSDGLLAAFGHNPIIEIPDFVGEVTLNREDIDRCSVRLRINAAALAMNDEIPEKDRRDMERILHNEVLETAYFPEIVYECSKIRAAKTGEAEYQVTLNGDLTIRRVTRTQPVSLQLTLNEDSLRACGTFSLVQTDYGLKLASIAGGALKVKDVVNLSFDIVARKTERLCLV